jgi:hypothetical protein
LSRVYILVTGAGANSVFRIGLLLVDTKNLGQANYDALLAQIKTVSDKPVKYVSLAMCTRTKAAIRPCLSAAGAQVIAHENEKKGLETYTNPAGTSGPPNVTYKTDYSIKIDSKEIAQN